MTKREAARRRYALSERRLRRRVEAGAPIVRADLQRAFLLGGAFVAERLGSPELALVILKG